MCVKFIRSPLGAVERRRRRSGSVARVQRFPAEFEAILSPRGRRVLAGKDPLCGSLAAGLRYVSAPDLLDGERARAALGLLERTLLECLTPMDQPIPPRTISAMKKNYSERLPKAVRSSTLLMASTRSKGSLRAAEIGLTAMLNSTSFHAFAESLSGYRLRLKRGTQVLCYRANDYAGPHNDHHPEDREARGGYLDLHLTFSNGSVAHQWLVYEHGGHLEQIQSINTLGGIGCYRLPLWHYTTPLVAKAGELDRARRWVLLGTFLDATNRRRLPAIRPAARPRR